MTKDIEKIMSGSFSHLIKPNQASPDLVAELGQVKHQLHSDEAGVKVQLANPSVSKGPDEVDLDAATV